MTGERPVDACVLDRVLRPRAISNHVEISGKLRGARAVVYRCSVFLRFNSPKNPLADFHALKEGIVRMRLQADVRTGASIARLLPKAPRRPELVPQTYL